MLYHEASRSINVVFVFIMNGHQKKVVVLQRVCTSYRQKIFSEVAKCSDLKLMVIFGSNSVKHQKVKSAKNLSGFKFKRLNTKFINIFGREFAIHRGLYRELKLCEPDVIISEGESHLFACVVAFFYKLLNRRKNVRLIYWGIGFMPGGVPKKETLKIKLRKIFWCLFDSFMLYSQFGSDSMRNFGVEEDKMAVCVNVGDTEKFLSMHDSCKLTKDQARTDIGIPDQFTILYFGALTAPKRPDVLISLAKKLPKSINFIILGDGELFGSLKEKIQQAGCHNIHMFGDVRVNLEKYLAAANVLLLPGRGGVAISECMAFALPVIVNQADGVEYDLIQQGKTGFICEIDSFEQHIEKLYAEPGLCHRMGCEAQNMIRYTFNTKFMVDMIISLIHVKTNIDAS